MEEEIWKEVAGYEGRYEVSNIGRVRCIPRDVEQLNKYRTVSIVHHAGKIISQRANRLGYMIVNLHPDRKTLKTHAVHQLVAKAFIPNPNGYIYVNHKDENKANNRVENLEWCDAKYNSNYGTGKWRNASKNKKPVAKYDTEGNLIATYAGIKEAAKDSTVSWQMISACLTRPNIRTAGGYVYKYIDKTNPAQTTAEPSDSDEPTVTPGTGDDPNSGND